MTQANSALIPAPISIAQASIATIGSRRAISMPCITLAAEALNSPMTEKPTPKRTLSGSTLAARYSCTNIIAIPVMATADPAMKARLTG